MSLPVMMQTNSSSLFAFFEMAPFLPANTITHKSFFSYFWWFINVIFFYFSFHTGPMIAILMLLPSLNSAVNPWIYLYFNPNLVSSFCSLFTRKSSSNSNLQSVGGKNSGATIGTNCSKGGRTVGTTICGHRTLTKMLTNDSGECSNSADSRSMRDNSRLDLISAAKETQGAHGRHARSVSSNFRPVPHIQQMKSCGTPTDISVVASVEDTNSTVTTVTQSINKLQPTPVGNHLDGHHHLPSNLSSMSNLNEETDTVATYESTVTLSTNSTVTTAGGSLCHQRHSKSKSAMVASGAHSGKVHKPRRRISIQLDKMWNKLATSNRRSSPTSSSPQVGLYHNSTQPCLTNSEQFTV